MLKTRIIPTLLYRDFGLVKGMKFDSRRAVGSPMQAIKVYNLRSVDELVFLDVTATQQGRGPDFGLIDDLADDCFMPLAVGGGVRTADDVEKLLQVGADKVVLNTAVIEDPSILGDMAQRFGSQCIVVSIDTKLDDAKRSDAKRSKVWTRSGTVATPWDPVRLAREVEDLGAGEILLTSIDRDGTMEGYDLETLHNVSSEVSIPVIASGGAGTYDDMRAAIQDGLASAVAAASMFHFTEQTPLEAKLYLDRSGIPVRF